MKNFNHSDKEINRFLRRSLICAIGVAVFFFIVFARLFDLQIISYHFYETLSKQNVISVVSVKPNRGLIYDRNGVLLAQNIPVYSLMIIPGRVAHLEKTISDLTPIAHLTPDDIQAFNHSLKQFRRYQAVPLKQNLTEAEVDQFYVNQYRFPGVIIQTDTMRNYPLGATTGNIIGYVARINADELKNLDSDNYTASDYIGKSGIEKEYENILHGYTGAETAEIDASGKIVRIIKQTTATPGENIVLTIDSKLQAFAEKSFGDNSGALVAIQPDTGQVLAMVSKPNFDPNLFVNGLSQAAYKSLLTAANHPLFDRATRGLYPPGSTIKPFIAINALNDGTINTKFTIVDTGVFQLPNSTHVYHGYRKGGFGIVNVIRAITVSCDPFFYQLATMMGIDRIDQGLAQFGFGQKTGIDLPDELAGLVPSPAWKEKARGKSWYPGDTVITGIGQGYLQVTPLQLAFAVATMANRGDKMQPNLLLKIQNLDGTESDIAPIAETAVNIHNLSDWNAVIQGMQGVILSPEGTAHTLFGSNAPYTIAGKTGTAQVFSTYDDEQRTRKNIPFQLRNNHLFIAFAPVDHPQIAIAIVVEHVPQADQIARQVLDYYFKELKQDQVTYPQSQTNAQIPSPQNQNTTAVTTAIPAPTTPTATSAPAIPAPTTPATLATPSIVSPVIPAPQNNNNNKKHQHQRFAPVVSAMPEEQQN